MPGFLTIKDLRRLLKKPAHVINHAIQRHGPEPSSRVGIIRLWQESDLPAIIAAVDRTSANNHRRQPEAVAR
jgi:hypothetical protein